jgi:MSHA biogenesis protein MshP
MKIDSLQHLKAPPKPNWQRGFSLVSAIFLLLILTGLGAIMLSVSGVQQTESTQDLQGSKAYQAAKTGIEWGTYLILNPENTNPATAPFTAQFNCPAGGLSTTGLPALPVGLTGFAINVACTRSDFIEGGNTISVYQLTSVATSGAAGSGSFVSRNLTATINTCRTVQNGAACS